MGIHHREESMSIATSSEVHAVYEMVMKVLYQVPLRILVRIHKAKRTHVVIAVTNSQEKKILTATSSEVHAVCEMKVNEFS